MKNTLKMQRQIKNMSQQQLAESVGLTRTYISNIERGKVSPSGDVILKIAKAIGKPVEQIFFTDTVLQVKQK